MHDDFLCLLPVHNLVDRIVDYIKSDELLFQVFLLAKLVYFLAASLKNLWDFIKIVFWEELFGEFLKFQEGFFYTKHLYDFVEVLLDIWLFGVDQLAQLVSNSDVVNSHDTFIINSWPTNGKMGYQLKERRGCFNNSSQLLWALPEQRRYVFGLGCQPIRFLRIGFAREWFLDHLKHGCSEPKNE